MNMQPLHENFKMPTRATDGSAGYDIYMPEAGMYLPGIEPEKTPLGFAAAVPGKHVALILPRSGAGFNHAVEINNTCGVIDSDYRGQWFAKVRTKDNQPFQWQQGDRLLQFIIVPVSTPELAIVGSLDNTTRGIGGIGSTGR